MSDRLQNCLFLCFKSTTLENFTFIPVVSEAKLKVFPIFYLDFHFIAMISYIFAFEFQKIIVLLLIYAPNFEKVGDILVSACPYVCMYVFMFEISS